MTWTAHRGRLVVDGSLARRGWLVVYWRIFGHQLSREIYDLDHSEKEIPCANEILIGMIFWADTDTIYNHDKNKVALVLSSFHFVVVTVNH